MAGLYIWKRLAMNCLAALYQPHCIIEDYPEALEARERCTASSAPSLSHSGEDARRSQAAVVLKTFKLFMHTLPEALALEVRSAQGLLKDPPALPDYLQRFYTRGSDEDILIYLTRLAGLDLGRTRLSLEETLNSAPSVLRALVSYDTHPLMTLLMHATVVHCLKLELTLTSSTEAKAEMLLRFRQVHISQKQYLRLTGSDPLVNRRVARHTLDTRHAYNRTGQASPLEVIILTILCELYVLLTELTHWHLTLPSLLTRHVSGSLHFFIASGVYRLLKRLFSTPLFDCYNRSDTLRLFPDFEQFVTVLSAYLDGRILFTRCPDCHSLRLSAGAGRPIPGLYSACPGCALLGFTETMQASPDRHLAPPRFYHVAQVGARPGACLLR